jgi:hypothetical protein
MENQNRAIQEFLSVLDIRFSNLEKRLINLESFEYVSTNFYGTEGIKSSENYFL